MEISELHSKKNALLAQVQPLVETKKRLYSKMNIETPMSNEEKELEREISQIFSQINSVVNQIRKIKANGTN